MNFPRTPPAFPREVNRRRVQNRSQHFHETTRTDPSPRIRNRRAAAGRRRAGGTPQAVSATEFCICQRERPLVAGEIVNYVYREEGKPDRAMKFCCRKCLARFKADPERFIKELERDRRKASRRISFEYVEHVGQSMS